jgi:lysozyme
VKPWESSYACFANNPIWFSDVNGDDGTQTSSGNGYMTGDLNNVVVRSSKLDPDKKDDKDDKEDDGKKSSGAGGGGATAGGGPNSKNSVGADQLRKHARQLAASGIGMESNEGGDVKNIKLSSKGLEFIKSFEKGPNGGPALSIYDDDNKNWNPGQPPTGFLTIGYGHKILPGEDFSSGITFEESNNLLNSDLKRCSINIINQSVKVPLSQNQYDALVSYVYNTGSLKGTQLLKKLNASDFKGAVKEMDINKSNGKYSRGLQIRRNAEHNIFNNSVYENH